MGVIEDAEGNEIGESDDRNTPRPGAEAADESIERQRTGQAGQPAPCEQNGDDPGGRIRANQSFNHGRGDPVGDESERPPQHMTEFPELPTLAMQFAHDRADIVDGVSLAPGDGRGS